jgi:hypothetical protein
VQAPCPGERIPLGEDAEGKHRCRENNRGKQSLGLRGIIHLPAMIEPVSDQVPPASHTQHQQTTLEHWQLAVKEERDLKADHNSREVESLANETRRVSHPIVLGMLASE